ncbi:MAG TPA: hypothetical protein VN822_10195 [Candidatus Acidoferrales bacterium]|nr:hypothetical protein [Candidatus Acidoferrales bacterium]
MLARVRILRLLGLTIAGATIAGAALTGVALGDTLELKTGQIVQGKFLGGSPMNIRFQVDGKEQVFATRDVLNIGFSDSADASSVAAPATSAMPAAPAAPAAMAPSSVAPQTTPTTQVVTIPAGTSLLVRMIDSVDSSQNRIGDKFHASLESGLVVGNTVVAPKGADVYGKLAQAKEAGKISGSAQLTLELTGVRINGNVVPVDSTTYDVAGKGRGTQSAERIGGGAVLGTIIGAVAGGGKGAVIGGAVGAGAGTAVQVMTHGDQVRIPSETLLEFKTEHDVTAPASNSTN